MTPTPLEPAPLSVLSSPPTSPTSPRTTTRVRIKAPRQPGSEGHGVRTRSNSPSSSRIMTADTDTSGSENKSTATASQSVSVVTAKRRLSSIAYYTPSSPSPWSQRPQSNRTLSSGVDGPRDGEPVTGSGRESVSRRSSLVLSSRSPSTHDSVGSSDGAGAREREPLTLVEKHADLLHFIAQKERKCLELRDQLAAHEKELAELKRKWERIVNRGHDPLPNSPITAGLGGVALDGLKEGVRIIAAGFSDLGGVIHELESGDKDPSSRPKPLTHALRENHSACAKRTGSQHPSTSSMSSIQESVPSDDVPECGEGETMATASSLARAGSLICRIHRRASRTFSVEEPTTTPPSTFAPSTSGQSPESMSMDVGMSFILAPSPTLVPPLSLLGTAPALTRLAPTSPVVGPTQGPAPVPTAAGSMSAWMDSMGKRLSGLHNGPTLSKGQKRASSLLAGVSNTLVSALSPGPTPTTPAPPPALMPSLMSKSSQITLPPAHPSQPHHQLRSEPHPNGKTTWGWLDDDDEEQTVRASTGAGGVGVLVPDSRPPPPPGSAVSSFGDDDWNW